jgi:hypothetical protein
MSNYKPRKARVGTSLDELGIVLGLKRLEDESLEDYRKRLILQVEDKPNQSEKSFIDTVSRNVGLFEEDMFQIDLVLDSDGSPIAPAPRVEINSCYLKVWSDYVNSEPDLVIDIYHRGRGYFLGQVEEKLRSLTFINITVLSKEADLEEDSYKYKRSWNLKCGNSDEIAFNQQLKPMKMNRFKNYDKTYKRYIHNCLFTSPLLFSKEVDDYNLLTISGDYYIDYTNGIIFTYSTAGGLVSFEYRQFPYKLTYQPVKVLPFEDEGMLELKKDYLISDETGKEERLSLNSYGAKVTNAIIKAYPLQWGE